MRPARIRDAQEAFGPVIAGTYGQTEAPQIITNLSSVELMQDENLASAGRPSLFTDVGIMDDESNLLPPGEQGEIVVRGDLVMTGYFNMPDETAETIRDGWLHTGDLGVFDDRGISFCVTGYAKSSSRAASMSIRATSKPSCRSIQR